MRIEDVMDNANKLQKENRGIFRQGNCPANNPKQLLNETLLKYLLNEIFSKDIFADLNTKNPYIDFKKLILEDLPIKYRKIFSEDRMAFAEKINKEEIKNKDGEILNDKLKEFFVEYYKYEPHERNQIIRIVKKSMISNLQTIYEEEPTIGNQFQAKSASLLYNLNKKRGSQI